MPLYNPAVNIGSIEVDLTDISNAVVPEVAEIKAKTDNLPSDPADASDIAASFATVNTKLDTIDDYIDSEVAAIKAKTDNLPSDPADQSLVEAAIQAAEDAIRGINGDTLLTIKNVVDIIDSRLDTEIPAIKAVTDALPNSGALTSIAQAASFTVPTADSADNIVARDVIGNKSDTVAGNSIVSIGKQIYARQGAPAGASQSADTAAVKAETASILTQTSSATSSGTYTYTNAGGEQTIATISTSARRIINGIWLDTVNLTKNGTIDIYYKIDGTNYRKFYSEIFVSGGDFVGLFLPIYAAITNDFQIRYTEAEDEGADRNIPYAIIYEIRS